MTTDLLFIGTGLAYADVDRPNASRKLNNATGDEIVTDGKISVVQLAKARDATEDGECPRLPSAHKKTSKLAVER